MAQNSLTLQDLFQAQDWRFGHVLANEDAQEFITKSGIITGEMKLDNSFSQAVQFGSVPNTINGFIRSHKLNSFPLDLESRSTAINVADDDYHSFTLKTFSRQFLTSLNTYESKTRYGSINMEQFLQKTLGNDVYIYMLRLISSMINNLTYVAETNEGDGTAHFSKALVDNLLSKTYNSGNFGINGDKIIGIFMNNNTLSDILEKQTAGVHIKSTLIDHRTNMVITNNTLQGSQSDLTQFYYLNGTPVFTRFALKDGVIAILKQGAFYLDFNDFNDPIIMLDTPPQIGGREKILQTQAAFLLHPNGFSFTGQKGTDYAKNSGPTDTEFNNVAKPLFEVLPGEYINFAKVLTMKVKIGA